MLLENDEYGNPVADQSGTQVVLDNGVDVFKTTTAPDGSWQVANAPANVYTISASRAGYSGLVNSAQDTLTNVQYVGAGTFTVQELRLSTAISPTLITEPTALVEWKIRKDSSDHGVKYDSTVNLTIRARTKNVGTFLYNAYISDRPDADCGQAIIKTTLKLKAENGEITMPFSWASNYGELRRAFGKDIRGLTCYIQLRPYFYTRTAGKYDSKEACIQPAVAQVTF